MTRKEAFIGIRKMRQYREKVTSSKREAQRALIRAGIMTNEGQIEPRYRLLFAK